MPKLTPRESDLIACLLQGKTDKEMGFELGLTNNTVKNYFARLCRKLNVKGRVQLVIWCYENKR